jgi:hypothetical protein
VLPLGTLPYPTSVGGTVPVREEAGLGPFSVLPQDWGALPVGSLRCHSGQRARAGPPRGARESTATGTLTALRRCPL